jgi:hypothetical protein
VRMIFRSFAIVSITRSRASWINSSCFWIILSCEKHSKSLKPFFLLLLANAHWKYSFWHICHSLLLIGVFSSYRFPN